MSPQGTWQGDYLLPTSKARVTWTLPSVQLLASCSVKCPHVGSAGIRIMSLSRALTLCQMCTETFLGSLTHPLTILRQGRGRCQQPRYPPVLQGRELRPGEGGFSPRVPGPDQEGAGFIHSTYSQVPLCSSPLVADSYSNGRLAHCEPFINVFKNSHCAAVVGISNPRVNGGGRPVSRNPNTNIR